MSGLYLHARGTAGRHDLTACAGAHPRLRRLGSVRVSDVSDARRPRIPGRVGFGAGPRAVGRTGIDGIPRELRATP